MRQLVHLHVLLKFVACVKGYWDMVFYLICMCELGAYNPHDGGEYKCLIFKLPLLKISYELLIRRLVAE